MAGASAVNHDLFACVLGIVGRDGGSFAHVAAMRRSGSALPRSCSGLAFRTQNIAYMVMFAFAIAASANFPVLVLATGWRRLTTAGALAGGITGLVSALGLAVIGLSIWVKPLGFTRRQSSRTIR